MCGAEREEVHAVVMRLRRIGLHGSTVRVGGLVGNCIGSSAALMYAREYRDVAKVLSVAGRLKMGRGIKERFGEEAVRRMGGGAHGQWEKASMRSSAGDFRGGDVVH